MKSRYLFHHIGIATNDIESCINTYKELGYTSSVAKIEPSQNVKIAFLHKSGSPILEVLEPTNKDSPIYRIVQSSGTTPYHTCYEVENINDCINELEDLAFKLLFDPIKSVTMENRLFCYLFSPDIGLIELIECTK